MLTKCVTIINKRGLHARAAARFAKLAEEFDAEFNVEAAGLKVSALSTSLRISSYITCSLA